MFIGAVVVVASVVHVVCFATVGLVVVVAIGVVGLVGCRSLLL